MSRIRDVSCVFVCHDEPGRIRLTRCSAGSRDDPGTWDRLGARNRMGIAAWAWETGLAPG